MKALFSKLIRVVCLCWVLIPLVLLFNGCGKPPEKYLVGAYYYVWYPYNFQKKGFLRKFLQPPQPPVLGYYRSDDAKVAERHIGWCSQYGIDFLALDWWPSRPQQNKVITDGFMKARNLGDIKFCIFYETRGLGFDRSGTIEWTSEKIEWFIADMVNVAELFFNHTSYLKIRGRPVVFLYLTRTFCGDYQEALRKLRSVLRNKGFNPFIIGDEVFWEVIAAERDENTVPHKTFTPQMERIHLFDAITSYNMYESQKHEQGGYGASSRYLSDVEKKYEEYLDVCGDKVAFVPNVIPGYNDRGVRLSRDHYVIPRQWEENAPEGSFFSELFDRIGLKYADPDLNMIMITTWNEWNEDTAIEPLSTSPPTSRDQSESGRLFTEGYSYAGFGTTCLEIIRDKVVSVSGQVRDKKGKPVPGVTVCGWSGKKLKTSDRTDRNGYYNLSRLPMQEGLYKVGIKRQDGCQVDVERERATLNIDLILENGKTIY